MSAAIFVYMWRHLFIYQRLKLALFTPRYRLGQSRQPSLFTYYVTSDLEVIDPVAIFVYITWLLCNFRSRSSTLSTAVCRERPELWVRVRYMKLCVDTDWTVGDCWVHVAVRRHRPELCRSVCYERQNSNPSLYCTPHYSADSATVAPFLCKLCN